MVAVVAGCRSVTVLTTVASASEPGPGNASTMAGARIAVAVGGSTITSSAMTWVTAREVGSTATGTAAAVLVVEGSAGGAFGTVAVVEPMTYATCRPARRSHSM